MNRTSSESTPTKCQPPCGRVVGRTEERDDPPSFDWAALVPSLVHPTRVAMVEAMSWIGRPLSPTDLTHILDNEFTVSYLSYHVRELRKMEVMEKVSSRQVRGATESFYVLREMK
ncbi:MAG TPA: hypothetical protein VGO24_07900 [Solirubrobacterales bacterium]|nr:hypothetical protein [Solirubrobacterales bacterium]